MNKPRKHKIVNLGFNTLEAIEEPFSAEHDQEDYEMVKAIYEQTLDMDKFLDFAIDRRLLFGHAKSGRQTDTKKRIILNKVGLDIVHPNSLITSISRFLKFFVRKISPKHRMLVVAYNTGIVHTKIRDLCAKYEMPCVVDKWYGGMLTNFVVFTRRAASVKHQISEIEDAKLMKLKVDPRQTAQLKKQANKVQTVDQLKMGFDSAFFFHFVRMTSAIHECHLNRIRTAVVCDTNAYDPKIAMPIYGNDDHILCINFYYNLLRFLFDESLTLTNTPNHESKHS